MPSVHLSFVLYAFLFFPLLFLRVLRLSAAPFPPPPPPFFPWFLTRRAPFFPPQLVEKKARSLGLFFFFPPPLSVRKLLTFLLLINIRVMRGTRWAFSLFLFFFPPIRGLISFLFFFSRKKRNVFPLSFSFSCNASLTRDGLFSPPILRATGSRVEGGACLFPFFFFFFFFPRPVRLSGFFSFPFFPPSRRRKEKFSRQFRFLYPLFFFFFILDAFFCFSPSPRRADCSSRVVTFDCLPLFFFLFFPPNCV